MDQYNNSTFALLIPGSRECLPSEDTSTLVHSTNMTLILVALKRHKAIVFVAKIWPVLFISLDLIVL